MKRNEDIFVTRGVTSADKITKITEEKKSVGGRAPERSATLYSTRIRKPSISMPTNLDEMEDLRIDRQKVSEKVKKKIKKKKETRYVCFSARYIRKRITWLAFASQTSCVSFTVNSNR